MLKINHIQIHPLKESTGCLLFTKRFPKIWLGRKWNTTFWVSTCRKLPGATEYLNIVIILSSARNVPNENSYSISSKPSTIPEFQVFAPFFGTGRNWFVSMVNAIPGKKKLSVLNFWFAYHFPKRWTNKFYYVSKYNSKQPLCTIPYHQVNSVISLRTSNRPGLMNFYFCVVHLRKSESQGRANSIAVRLSHFLHNQGILHKPWAWRRRRYVIFIFRCARS